MWKARGRLASLWVSQTARSLADNGLRMFVILQIAPVGDAERNSAWPLVTAFYIAPFILLAPFNGAISNGLPKRDVLIGSAFLSLVGSVVFSLFHGPWLGCILVAALGSAIYSPTRYALLPAAAEDTLIPLTRINGWMEMGGASGIIAGFFLAIYLNALSWNLLAGGLPSSWLATLEASGIPLTMGAIIVLDALALVTAIPVFFPSDLRRADAPVAAVVGFFRDCGRIMSQGKSRASLLGLVSFLSLVTAGVGPILAYSLDPNLATKDVGVENSLLPHVAGGDPTLQRNMFVVLVGVALGSLLASLQGHPRRSLGLVPFGATGLLMALVWTALSPRSGWPSFALGLMGGLVNAPLRADYQASVPTDARGNGMSIMNTANYIFTTALLMLLFVLGRGGLLAPIGQLWLLACISAVGAVVTWKVLFRESLEQLTEILIWPIYRIYGHGPGLEHFPQRVPLLLVANHSAWLDPLWAGKIVPRKFIPMMTSVFYDLPGMRWLMENVVHAIRVELSHYRREAPELQEAIGALKKGQCVLLFPEGAMRRGEEKPLRMFGQGVWHILRECPQTPVVVLWIEGGWGSFFSHYRGRPTKNKSFDLWRRIDVAVTKPQLIDSSVLADQRATRLYLMQACLNARAILGLPPYPMPTHLQDEATEDHDDDQTSAGSEVMKNGQRSVPGEDPRARNDQQR